MELLNYFQGKESLDRALVRQKGTRKQDTDEMAKTTAIAAPKIGERKFLLAWCVVCEGKKSPVFLTRRVVRGVELGKATI